MKRIVILTALGIFGGLSASIAQLPAADKVKTTSGDLKIQPIFHAAMVLSWNNKTIYVDPYNGPKAYKGQEAPDLILITDIHGDHMDTATLNALNTSKAKMIVPKAVADMLPEQFQASLIVINNGANTVAEGITITAIPMYNLPESPDAKHTKGRGNGYVLEMGGKRIYISGDTEDIPEMRNLKNVDVAFVCMNLPYTMPVDHAASATLDFKPRIVYPYHYRNQDGFSEVATFKSLVNKSDKNIEVRLKDWYAKP